MGRVVFKMKKQGLLYWGTIVPLVGAVGILYFEYKNLEAELIRGQKVFNRQLELIEKSHREEVRKMKK
jgi:ribosomal protein L35AE/L33A